MSRLDDAMNRLAADLAGTEAPPELERVLLAEFDRTKRRRRVAQWIATAGAVAASIGAVWVVGYGPGHKSAPSPVAVQTPAQQPADTEQPFVPIPYVLPPAPYERVQIVRMQVPVAALIAAGFVMQNADAGAQAEADVMVGQDGRARAVRLISISN